MHVENTEKLYMHHKNGGIITWPWIENKEEEEGAKVGIDHKIREIRAKEVERMKR